jgi:alanyl-tRNA synthetase
MNQQPAYLLDPLKLEFEATIIKKTGLAGGQFDLILAETYFYPTGGGQPHDTGTLGEARVVDVFKDHDGQVVHRVDRAVAGTTAPARIDRARRLGHMQHHSAQHILSAALEQVLGLETLSVKISANTPATVDVADVEISWPDLNRVEQAANDIIFENRSIKSYFIDQAQIGTVPFRRPPQVSGPIRVVEVDSFDYSACGGTHCPSTGMLGLVKIIKTERKNKKLRLHFVAGGPALAYFQHYHHTITTLGQQLNTGPDELVALVELQADQLHAAEREIKNLQAEILFHEAEKLLRQARTRGGCRLVSHLFPDRSPVQLRELARLLQNRRQLVAVLGGYDGQQLSLVVTSAEDAGIDAREILARYLTRINGQGGGNARLAQGGGPAAAAQVEQLFAPSPNLLENCGSQEQVEID